MVKDTNSMIYHDTNLLGVDGQLVSFSENLCKRQSKTSNKEEEFKYQAAEMPSSADQASKTWIALHQLLFQVAWYLQLDSGPSQLFLAPFQLSPSFSVPAHNFFKKKISSAQTA
jgi:hypothetical protein